MAQHDYVIANGTGAAVRSDLNNALAAIVSQNSGATAPATTYAFQFWADTTTGLLKLRNSANSAWITLFQLDGEWSTLPVENGTAAAPSIYFKDSGTDTGFYSPGTDQVGISTGGTSRLTIDANGNLAVDTNTLYVDAPNNRVGIGTSTVDQLLHLKASAPKLKIEGTGTSDEVGIHFAANANNWFIRSDNFTGQNTFSIKSGTPASSTHRLLIDSSGNVGIGTTSPSSPLHVLAPSSAGGISALIAMENNHILRLARISPAANPGNFDFTVSTYGHGTISADNQLTLQAGTSAPLVFNTSGANERARIDSSGRLLVGTSTARSNFFNTGIVTAGIQAESTGEGSIVAAIRNVNDATTVPVYLLAKSRGTSVGSNTIVQSGDHLGYLSFQGSDGSEFVEAARISGEVDGTPGANDMPGRLVFSTTADGASSPTERMRIDNQGAVSLASSVTNTTVSIVTIQGGSSGRVLINNYSQSGNEGWSGSNTVLFIGKQGPTSRSINAAGTINASGADYAEYMVKAGDFNIAKGDVCGVTADGLLTIDYSDAVSFVVKSTNPSYVGGDTWGTEDAIGVKPNADDVEALTQWEADLEAARQTVDRIAFAGQVPVNVLGSTPGQYIVPVEATDGGIEGIAKSEADLTLAEYMRAVGKVIAIEDDGRARIIVKVA